MRPLLQLPTMHAGTHACTPNLQAPWAAISGACLHVAESATAMHTARLTVARTQGLQAAHTNWCRVSRSLFISAADVSSHKLVPCVTLTVHKRGRRQMVAPSLSSTAVHHHHHHHAVQHTTAAATPTAPSTSATSSGALNGPGQQTWHAAWTPKECDAALGVHVHCFTRRNAPAMQVAGCRAGARMMLAAATVRSTTQRYGALQRSCPDRHQCGGRSEAATACAATEAGTQSASGSGAPSREHNS
ncbi:hypothetical protein COO60DRAFT_1486878 [Scenedesmus sp. NREL 46B-D3]|nr:hypothetical protein COO60DRAFT_1486878 [Scenedesmus sp. NREL 46B-D3]